LADVHYPTARESRSRHDLTLAVIGKLFADSLWLTRASLYSSTADRVFSDAGSMENEAAGTYPWSLLGARLHQQLHGSFFEASIGAQGEVRTIDAFANFAKRRVDNVSFFALSEVRPLNQISIATSVKQEHYGDADLFSFAGKAAFHTGENIRLSAHYSKSSRYPAFFEIALLSPVSILPPFEKHRITSFELATGSGESSFSSRITAFRRSIENAIYGRPVSSNGRYVFPRIEVVRSVTFQGVSAEIRARVWKFHVSGLGTYTEPHLTGDENFSLPRLTIAGELSFRDTFFNDKLDARLAVRSRYAGKNSGMRFVPAYSLYVLNDRSEIGEFSTFDLYGIFKIGDAYLSLTWENIPDINYLTTPIYPMLGRSIRFGLNWVFID
jgi:outer membrane cobalamin receptor